METKEQINDYVLKLGGKVSLLEPIDLGHNYKITISGSITEKTDKDNEDGTLSRYYKFEPITVEVLNELGKRIKSKDSRSKSKQLRACIYALWKNSSNSLGDEEFYDRVMDYIIYNSDSLAEKASQNEYWGQK